MTEKENFRELSSLVTLKNMYNKHRTKYEVLGEFIKDILLANNISYFKATEIKEKLKCSFEFSLPIGVIEAALSRMDNVSTIQQKMIQTNLNIALNRQKKFAT